MNSRIPKFNRNSFLSFSILKTFLLLVCLVEGSYSIDEDDIDPCDLPTPQQFHCYCPNDDPYTNEELQCQVVKDVVINDTDPRWGSFKKLNVTRSLTFINRPERALTFFPPGHAFAHMKNLHYFVVKFAKLNEIPSFAFGNSSSLIDVNLIDNMIQNLAPQAFANMNNLTRLSLGKNLITDINRDVFANLGNLTGLYLEDNRIRIIHDRAFKDLGNLTELELQNNNLTVLIGESFIGLSNLKRLDLRGNTIEYLGDHVFAKMPNLQDLDLGGNMIHSLSPGAFAGLQKVLRLNLQENKIIELAPHTFDHLRMIHFLDLRRNELGSLGKALIRPIYSNLKNVSMQLMIEGNRFVCDCSLLWMGKLYTETASTSVKEHLNKTSCNLFQKPHHHSSHHHVKDARVGMAVSESHHGNITMEETTTYQSYDGSRPVVELTSDNLNCHHEAGHMKGFKNHRDEETDVVDIESHDESAAPSKEILPRDRHAMKQDSAPATEKARAYGDSEKEIQHSLTENSKSHSHSLPPSSSSANSFSLYSHAPINLKTLLLLCPVLLTFSANIKIQYP